MFPLKVTKRSFDHRGGTKEYHTLLIAASNGDERGLLVKRWGKTGAWGQLQFIGGDTTRVTAEYDKVIREKSGRGYSPTKQTDRTVNSVAELREAVGPGYWREMGSYLPDLLPDVDPAEFVGAKSAAEPRWDDEGNPTGAGPRKPKLVDETPPSMTVTEQIAANPLWGSF
jgi:predicted DNA-binding WGR domain protein